MVELRHLRADDSGIVGFQHEYDRRNNRISENKLHDPVNSETYQYDSAYRLRQLDRPDAGSLAPIHGVWDMDGVGNWLQVDGETRMHSSFNELIETDDGSGGITTHQYDENGNQINEGFLYEWDSRNRLSTVARNSDGVPIATYRYDALNRRIRKVISNSGPLDGVTDYYYDGLRVIEERDGSDVLVQQYVYGRNLDEPLVLDRNLDGGPDATDPGDQRLFYHQNALGSSFGMTDLAGAIVEGYQYDAYGRQTVFQPGPNGFVDFGGDDVIAPGGVSALGNPYLFTGRRLDPETGLYYYRNRYYNPEQGKFIQRDPTGYRDGMGLYQYGTNNPINVTDNLGLEGKSVGRRSVEAGAESVGTTVAVEVAQRTGQRIGVRVAEEAVWLGAKVGGTVISVGLLLRDLHNMTEAFKDRNDALRAQKRADTSGRKLEQAITQKAHEDKLKEIKRKGKQRDDAFRRGNLGDPEAIKAREREQQRRNAKICNIFFGGSTPPPDAQGTTITMINGIPSRTLAYPSRPHGTPHTVRAGVASGAGGTDSGGRWRAGHGDTHAGRGCTSNVPPEIAQAPWDAVIELPAIAWLFG